MTIFYKNKLLMNISFEY